MNRVVITGIGIYSCIGKNLDEVSNSLYKGKSGIILDMNRKEFGYRSGLTGFVERPNLRELLDRRSRIMLPEQGEYAYVATLEALAQAGIDQDYLNEKEAGILYGNDSSAKAIIDATDIIRGVPNYELNRNHESGYNIQAKRNKLQYKRGLCQRLPCNWAWIPFYKKRIAGLHHLWRSPGNQSICHGQF